jgi:hypothetical protein
MAGRLYIRGLDIATDIKQKMNQVILLVPQIPAVPLIFSWLIYIVHDSIRAPVT